MALNITIDGYNFDKDSILGSMSVHYQAYFYANGTASSASKWNDVKILDSASYFNFNLGDLDFLGQTGVVLNNSIVLVVFWKGSNNRIDNCGALTEWGAFEIVMSGLDTYTQDSQTKGNIPPDLHWSTDIPVHPYVDTNYTITNTSEDEHSWNFNGIISSGSVTMNHWYQRYGQIINGPNKIDNTDIFWGDGNSSMNLVGAIGDTYQWTTAGTYDIDIVIEDDCGATVTGTDSFNMYWHEPVPNITMIPSNPDPNEQVYFIYSGTDIDDRITSIDWTINDSGPYGNTNTTTTSGRDDTVAHADGEGTDWYGQGQTDGAFTNPDIHNIEIVIHWNDGFSNQVINYDKDFIQNKFSGPALSFSQNPPQATISSGVEFINTSINVGRVGLGLPDHIEYEWTWYDDTLIETIDDQNYSYKLVKTPVTTDCEVELCADWSDGWETMTTCLREDVVFDTTVTVTPEDCYYVIDVIGTSSDGSVSGYGWTISSGTSSSGVWIDIWNSPTGISQKEKTLCFSSTGWYKIEGSVYGTGTTTSDYETLFINETCPDSGSKYNIWNGTGVLDVGSDWNHMEKGIESSVAMHLGTNGLLVEDSIANDIIEFHRSGYSEIDINNYDFLSFWMNIKHWQQGTDIKIKLDSTLGNSGVELNVSNYVVEERLNIWHRVMIPLQRFRITADESQVGWPTYVNRLVFTIEGEIDFWLDDISLIIGEVVTIPVCTPNMETHQAGASPSPHLINVQPCSNAYPRPINI